MFWPAGKIRPDRSVDRAGPPEVRRQSRVYGALGPNGQGDGTQHQPPVAPSGDYMATTNTAAPSREDFAAMLDESFESGNLQEGAVIKGTVVGIEKDLAVIDVGLKTEGRVALREFAGPGRRPI
jgi:small subunit ribosomal protein S1